MATRAAQQAVGGSNPTSAQDGAITVQGKAEMAIVTPSVLRLPHSACADHTLRRTN